MIRFFSFLFIFFYLFLLYIPISADPREKVPIKHFNQPYMEWSQPKDKMPREFRLLKEGMSGQFLDYKAHLNAILHTNTPGYKRYSFVNYLNKDEDIIPIQYIDWSKERPIISHRLLDTYVTGKFNFFCLEPQNEVELYTFDGRFYKDSDGLLRSTAHHLPIMGEEGPIYLTTNYPTIDEKGNIFENDTKIAKIKIKSFKSNTGLWTIEGSVFYQREPKKTVINDSPDYSILQGYFEGQNEPHGIRRGRLIVPFGEALANSAKKYIDSYELLFDAVIEK